MKVLVAEDDLTLQQMVRIMLANKNIDCTLVSDGQSAVQGWENGAYDLILMDVQMPETNGLEATRIIREKEKRQGGHVPIIAMTAHALPEDMAVCREAGMDDYLVKPIDFNKFYSLLETYGSSR